MSIRKFVKSFGYFKQLITDYNNDTWKEIWYNIAYSAVIQGLPKVLCDPAH